ncbi:MAG: putative peptidoglycan glycosyltransferase FtsW [Chthoniobacteraceae bacterium]|nr:putative peptidoglycan glycosyltransferase FtsW [Chthoniobacteraceae bacterium]
MKFAALGLLLSVTTMVVIGMVMLFSTGSFSRDAFKVRKAQAKSEVAAAAAAVSGSSSASLRAAASVRDDDDASPELSLEEEKGTKEIFWDPAYLVKRQAMWLGLGVALCIVAARVDYLFWKKTWPAWFALAAVLLLVCFVFPRINGSHRWIRFGPFSFQPSEIGKLAGIAFLAAWYQRFEAESRTFLKGIVYPLLIVGILLGLIAPEVDLGTTAVLGGTAFAMLFVAGAPLRYLLPLPALGIGGILSIAFLIPERVSRLTAFLDLEGHKDGSGYQQLMGLIALGSGGVDGLGLGMGRQKFMFLPEAHTDFIFPTIGEELGLVFTLLIVFCYVVMIICGIAIALNARERFGLLMGVGITVILALQAALNIGVTTAVLPNKGIPLPFISYGGSNLLFCLLGIGILLSIYRKGGAEKTVRATTRPRPLMTPRI